MFKLVALYQRPANLPVFDQHFAEVHLPLLRIIPGLLQLVVTPGIALPWGGGDTPYYLLTEIHFQNRATFELAMHSPQYHAVHSDMQTFARDLFTLITLWGD